jgi:hypothetical protein
MAACYPICAGVYALAWAVPAMGEFLFSVISEIPKHYMPLTF